MKALLAVALLAFAPMQDLDGFDGAPVRNRQYVSYLGEQQTITAGKRGVLELKFQVNDGFHVNSHSPKSELLIPTVLELQPAAGVKVAAAEYPAGTTFSFSFDPNEKLDVYEGGFSVKVPVSVKAGTYELHGMLSYQACDQKACYPPRSLPVAVDFTAK